MRSFIKLFGLLAILFAFFSCANSEENKVKKTAKEFYLSYQNMDFDEIVEYCTPLMAERIRSIESGMTPEKRDAKLAEMKAYRMTVDKVELNADGTEAVVTCTFTQPKTKESATDRMELQKIGDEWKVSEF